ncbi:hypothetical protein [Roseivirga pacifica]|uniref:hypothetical protein n=1 Tax=Roseivirga pacifica TaxID=1267423 RepID=UPI00209631FB|nr:hypothetical protein [Roseivirga pacifica]MCO6359317.1 hypothetical protein [Roseivirga pacifica]MCO6366687.1 hypothetical protein [Roseivirga pacifica]MCO6370781.1 hypothetical protein [Roseivirga pacifica]MCO6374343.1 hypothetical protein [Roseivirga pacifica]MCO6379602.1 hypothetical protein [Roseivirga pacifica]
MMVLGGALLFTHQRFDFRKKPKLGQELGDFLISSEGLQVLDRIISYSDINCLRLWYGDYHMKIIPSQHIGYYFHIGTENRFECELKDGSKVSHNFMVWNRNHETDLVKSIKYFYQNKILVFENGPKGRTFLGEDLSYEELQEFKSEYDLKTLGYKNIS